MRHMIEANKVEAEALAKALAAVAEAAGLTIPDTMRATYSAKAKISGRKERAKGFSFVPTDGPDSKQESILLAIDRRETGDGGSSERLAVVLTHAAIAASFPPVKDVNEAGTAQKWTGSPKSMAVIKRLDVPGIARGAVKAERLDEFFGTKLGEAAKVAAASIFGTVQQPTRSGLRRTPAEKAESIILTYPGADRPVRLSGDGAKAAADTLKAAGWREQVKADREQEPVKARKARPVKAV